MFVFVSCKTSTHFSCTWTSIQCWSTSKSKICVKKKREKKNLFLQRQQRKNMLTCVLATWKWVTEGNRNDKFFGSTTIKNPCFRYTHTKEEYILMNRQFVVFFYDSADWIERKNSHDEINTDQSDPLKLRLGNFGFCLNNAVIIVGSIHINSKSSEWIYDFWTIVRQQIGNADEFII